LETSITESKGRKTNEMPGSEMGGEGRRNILAWVICSAKT